MLKKNTAKLKMQFLLGLGMIGVFPLKVVAQEKTVSAVERQQIIKIKEIEIVGNTIFSDSELRQVLNITPGTQISLEKLLTVQKKIDRHYIDNGYINSGSFLPPQEIVLGKARIQVVEGTLENIQIKGANSLSEQYLKSRLPEEGKPLNINQIVESIKRLQNEPLIEKINGQLVEQAGRDTLLLDVVERNPLSLSAGGNNAYSPSVGSLGGKAQLTHQNLLGLRDRLNLERSQTSGLTRTGVSYSVPFNQLDGRVSFAYSNADSAIIEEEIEDLEIEADFSSWALSIEQPLVLSSKEELNLGLGIQYVNSETFVLEDLSFSFVEGLENGESKITTLNFFQNYTRTGDASLFSIQSQFNVGLDVFDATKNALGIDGLFWNWEGSITSVRALDEAGNIILNALLSVQLTPDKLLPIDQFTMGGVGSVRGYRPNLAVADNGVLGNLELRFALFKGDWGKFSLVPFVDVGTVWNNDRSTTGSSTFASVGLGLQLSMAGFLQARIDYGLPVVEATGYGATVTQDNFSASLLIRPFQF